MNYKNIEYVECDEVYPPAEDTFLLIDNLKVEDEMDVLEIGGGTGLVSIFASLKANQVTVTDINPHAIKCIEANIKLNKKDNIHVLKSNLFENITSTYDLILFNTPYLPVDSEEQNSDDIYSKAWDGGVDGRSVIDEFLHQVKNYLKPNALIQIVQSSLSDNQKTINILEQEGFKAEITAKEHIFFEDITLITAKLL